MDRDRIQRFKFLFHTLARPDVKTHKDRIFVDSFVRTLDNILLVPRTANALMSVVNKFSDVFEYLYKNRPIIKDNIIKKKQGKYQKIRPTDFKDIENKMFKELSERRDQFVLPKPKFNTWMDILKMFKSTDTHIKLLYMGDDEDGNGIWYTLNNKTYERIIDKITN